MNYYNAKKVVIDQDLTQMDAASRAGINQTITYLKTNSSWSFKRGGFGLNMINSSIHVPTNIYDKCKLYINACRFTFRYEDFKGRFFILTLNRLTLLSNTSVFSSTL